MTLARLATRAVTYHRYDDTATDEYGDPDPAWVPDASTTDVWLEQTGATEVTVDADVQRADWLLVDPNPDAGLTGRDRVEVDGVMFRLVGPPNITHTPRGPHHLEARLTHVE